MLGAAPRWCNFRIADHPEVILPDEEQAARDSSREAAFTYGAYWKFSAIARELCRACCWTDHNVCPSREAARFGTLEMDPLIGAPVLVGASGSCRTSTRAWAIADGRHRYDVARLARVISKQTPQQRNTARERVF